MWGLRVRALGFKVWDMGLGLRLWALGAGLWDLRLRV